MRFFIALLAIAGIFDASIALHIHYQDPSQAAPCAITTHFDCGAVNHGRYAVFPPIGFDEAPNSGKFHFPVATLGIIGYALIGIFALAKRYWITLQLAEIGFAVAAFLSYLEAYVLEKWCIYCLWSLCIVTAILLLSIATLIMDHRRKRNSAAVYP